ncbi:unnamed protein product [Rhizophagus irregularis]|nr:unnamed protein product [Rhizophagus irregularis]
MYFEYCQEVATDFEKVLESDEEYDVIIYAGENMKALHAHLFVLRTRSQYFRTGFSKKWAEKKDGKFIFKKPNISYEIFKIILSSNAKVTNEKLNIFNVQSPRKSKDIYDSTLINPQHFAIFSSWIEKENDSHYNARNIPYNFNLLYRASRDGNTAADFHKKCDNKGATIVIAKVTDSEQIVGGYNPLFWNEKCNTNKSTNDSFIFTLTDRTNFQTAKVSYSNGDPNSIQNYSVHGPVFGATDLYENNGSNWCSKSDSISYPKIDEMPIGKFYVDDYEVFQVIKKA